MKKPILTLLTLLSICMYATAQFKSGQVLLGGNLSFTYTNATQNVSNNYVTANAININPTIGFFKSEKSLYSFGIIYAHNVSRYLTTSSGTQTGIGNNYGINLSKQYFTSIAKNLYFTLAGTFIALYENHKSSYDQSSIYQTDKGGFFSVGIAPGMSYKINNWLLCDLSLPNLIGLSFNTGTDHYFASGGADSKATRNAFNLGTNLNGNFVNNLAIGFRFML